MSTVEVTALIALVAIGVCVIAYMIHKLVETEGYNPF